MIQEFSVGNYLSIKDTQTLSFIPRKSDLNHDLFTVEISSGVRLLKSAVIYGSNASGKTNILKALEFLRLIVLRTRKRGENTGFVPFLFNQATKKSPGEFEIIFFKGNNKFRYYLKISESEVIEEELNYYPGQTPATIFYRKTVSEQDIIIEYSSTYGVNKAEREMIRARVLPNVSVLSSLGDVSTKNEILLKAYNWFLEDLKPIITPDTKLRDYTAFKILKQDKMEKLLTYLMIKADFNIEHIRAEKELIKIESDDITKLKEKFPEFIVKEIEEKGGVTRRNLSFFHKINDKGETSIYQLDEELESRGTWRYFGLAGPILESLKGHKTLFIDELDSSLHPDLLNFIYSMFLVNSKGAQIIFTIHNRELLEDKELQRRDLIWFTEKQRDGSTELYSIADISGIRKDQSFEKLYKTGKFGAIPNLGNLYLEIDYDED
ncbi:MAG: ATP-binding protein [Candidatus Cloacimonetes bacterium]|nr:ATP-binding protein [Candidatus Cloacimonadota bacterium]